MDFVNGFGNVKGFGLTKKTTENDMAHNYEWSLGLLVCLIFKLSFRLSHKKVKE